MPRVFIGLGSNIDSEKNLQKAGELLRGEWPDIRFSSVYRSAPVGYADQADFLNAVATFETGDSPAHIADVLKSIEQQLKKSISHRFGPRTIDIDLLLYADAVIDTPQLKIPHPRMQERRFVLEPLLELIELESRHPTLGTTWGELFQGVREQDCWLVDKKIV